MISLYFFIRLNYTSITFALIILVDFPLNLQRVSGWVKAFYKNWNVASSKFTVRLARLSDPTSLRSSEKWTENCTKSR